MTDMTNKEIVSTLMTASNSTDQIPLEMLLVIAAERIQSLDDDNESKQAEIDALMLEYCPKDMTPEQLENWGNHQQAVGSDT